MNLERYRVTLGRQRGEVSAPDAEGALCLVVSRLPRYRDADLRVLEGRVVDRHKNVVGSVQPAF